MRLPALAALAVLGAAAVAAPAEAAVVPADGYPVLNEPGALLAGDAAGRAYLGGDTTVRVLTPSGSRKLIVRPLSGTPFALAAGRDGDFAVAVAGGVLDAFAADGRHRWRRSVRARDSALAPLPGGGVLVGDGTFGGLTAYAASGAVRWSAPGIPPRAALAVAPDGAVRAAGFDAITAIDAGTGATRWVLPLGARRAGPAVATAPDSTLYAGTGPTPEVIAVAPDGALRWAAPVAGDVVGVAVAPDGRPYVADSRGSLSGLRAADGGFRWRTRVGLVTAGPVATSDGILWVGIASGRIVAVGPDGARRGSLDTGSRILTIAAAGGRVIAGAAAGAWSAQIGRPGPSRPALLRVSPATARTSAPPLARIGVGGARTFRLPTSIGATALVRTPRPGRLTLALRRVSDDAVCARTDLFTVPAGNARVRLPARTILCADRQGELHAGRYTVVATLFTPGRVRVLTAPLRVRPSSNVGIPDP